MCTKNHIKAERYPIKDILDNVGKTFIVFSNWMRIKINLYDLRYFMFKEKGCTCIKCGIEGKFFRRERSLGNGYKYNDWHLNLYAINNKGKEVLMTQDHIVPMSKGGEDTLDNLQPLCVNCNQKKGNK